MPWPDAPLPASIHRRAALIQGVDGCTLARIHPAGAHALMHAVAP